MLKTTKLLLPSYFRSFRCLGADCEDTCCDGWGILVDRTTYEKYQDCPEAELRTSLRSLVTINADRSNDDDYAKITLSGSRCPFLSQGLCSIQARLGEDYLSNMCATYPRVMNVVDDVMQGSMDLSCPEVARIVLLNPDRMEFDLKEYAPGSVRPANYPGLDTAGLAHSSDPYGFFREVRRMAISILQDRSRRVWKRLVILGGLCERLAGGEPLPAIQKYLDNIDESAFSGLRPQPTLQLEVTLELIVARISSDFNPRRFLDCYREFMQGIQWTTQSTMEEIGSRYAEAYSQSYAPFMSSHEYLLEHYLVNYAHRTLFPFGLPESNQRLRNNRIPSSITAQYMLMAAQFAVTKTVLIGMAAFHGVAFGEEQAVRVIQSCSRTFEHSLAYPGRAIGLLAEKNMITPASLAVLIQN